MTIIFINYIVKEKNSSEEQFSDSVSNSPTWDKFFSLKFMTVRTLCIRQNTLKPCAEIHLGIRNTLS